MHIYKELKSTDIIIIDKKFTRLGLTRFSCIVVVIVVEIIMSVSENIKKKRESYEMFSVFHQIYLKQEFISFQFGSVQLNFFSFFSFFLL